VHSEARLAQVGAAPGWAAEGLRPRVTDLTPQGRRALCAAWTRVGLMEHASIAAFARFTMQLMGVGAPASLIEASMEAMRDEARHTKLAFALASAYGEAPIAPGALDIAGSLDASDLASLVVTTVHEGCIGETVAAMEAAEALLHVEDPALRSVLAQIERDETQHAELAWRFVRWALAVGGEAVRSAAKATFASAIAASGDPRPRQVTAADRRLLAGGILPDKLHEQVRAVALRQVVRVCALALLDVTPSLAA